MIVVAADDRDKASVDSLNKARRSESLRSTRVTSLELEARTRIPAGEGSDEYKVTTRTLRWDPGKTAIIVCDMWDDHTCKAAAARVAEMAPAMNRTLQAARDRGVFIIHAPSGRVSFYQDTAQRRRALAAPHAVAPVEIKWNNWNPDREGEPLTAIVDGGCACKKKCPGFYENENGIRRWEKGGKIPWTRQIDTIDIAPADAISDEGQEIYNLLQDRGIDNVVLMGVHTNICIVGRPFGLRQMIYLGKDVALVRDLTDALFQPAAPALDHFHGTGLIVEHIERHLCPTIASTSFTGERAFRFKEDTRHNPD
jgi:nicotinamidase-related amidase